MVAFHHHLEVVDQSLDATINFFLVWIAQVPFACHHWSVRDLINSLFDDRYALPHLFHPDQEAVIGIADFSNRNFEIQFIVDKVWVCPTDIVGYSAGTQQRACEAVGNRFLFGEDSDVLHTVDEDLVASDELISLFNHLSNFFEPDFHFL